MEKTFISTSSADFSDQSTIATAVFSILDKSTDNHLPSEQSILSEIESEVLTINGEGSVDVVRIQNTLSLILSLLSAEGLVDKISYHGRCYYASGRGEDAMTFTIQSHGRRYGHVSRKEALHLLWDIIICLEVMDAETNKIISSKELEEVLLTNEEVIPLDATAFGEIDLNALMAWGISVLCQLNILNTRTNDSP